MEPIQQLNSELDAVVAEIEILAVKSDEDSAKKLATAQGKMQSLKTRIEALSAVQSVKSWQNEVPATPRATVPKPDGDGTKSQGTVGQTEIDLSTGEIVSQTGAGVLTGAQIKAATNPDYVQGFTAWLRAGGNETKMRPATKAASDAFLGGRDSEGGVLVPPELIAGIIRREPTPTAIADMVRTITLTRGDQAQMTKQNYSTDDLYSSAVRIYKTGEAEAAKKSDKPVFGIKRIDVHGWTGEISLSNRLLDDTGYDILGVLAEEFRTATRNLTADKILRGSGNGEHIGILSLIGKANGPEVINSGDAAKITWEGLRKIKNRVPEQYDRNCRYLFNKRSGLDGIEALVDGEGRPLWPEHARAGFVTGSPGSIHGYPYQTEAFMPDITANAHPVLFGDLTGYARILRLGMTIRVLTEVEARNGQTVFLVEFREGGDLIEPWKLKALKIAA